MLMEYNNNPKCTKRSDVILAIIDCDYTTIYNLSFRNSTFPYY